MNLEAVGDHQPLAERIGGGGLLGSKFRGQYTIRELNHEYRGNIFDFLKQMATLCLAEIFTF